MYKLDGETTVLQRMVRAIRKHDDEAEIVVVVGFMFKQIQKEMESENIIFVHNPYYAVTNSIASLWFAREYLQRENVVIINGDVVVEDRLVADVICKHTDSPYVLVDSANANIGKYNVQIQGDKVCVMSKQLSPYTAIYASVAKLDAVTSRFLLEKLENLVSEEMYNQYFEDVLVYMIFADNFELYFKDIKDYQWTEVDTVNDLYRAKEINNRY